MIILLASHMMKIPVESRHSADGQQQVQQRLGGVGQRVVLLQQVGQCGHLLTCQHVHNNNVPHSVARQEAVTEQTDDPAEERIWGLIFV